MRSQHAPARLAFCAFHQPTVERWASSIYRTLSSSATHSILSKLTNFEQQGVPSGSGTIAGSSSFDLGRMHRLLAALGNPHKQWPVVHVAGSKGKGSTATMISSILRSSGYSVGLYTSPHLLSITERINVQGSPISRLAFEALETEHAALIAKQLEAEGGRLSHFEALTALAFRHFADRKVDAAVVETGMGGTLDATNVFDESTLAVAVITPLGYEHVDALGGTIESIAAAKAGIMKAGRPVVVAQQGHGRATETLQHAAHGLGCRLINAQDQVQVSSMGYTLLDQPSSTLLRSNIMLHFVGSKGEGGQSDAPSQQRDHRAAAADSRASLTEGFGGASLGQANRLAAMRDASIHRGSDACSGADEGSSRANASMANEAGHTDSSSSSNNSSGAHQLGPMQVALVGQHQETNVATAVASCLQLRSQGWAAITDAAVQDGLEAARLPGRLQVLRLSPPVPMGDLAGSSPNNQQVPASAPASKGPLLVLDGAHTRESAASLVTSIRSAFPARTHPLVLVVAMAEDKDARQVLAELRRLQPKAVIFTTVPIAGSYHRSAAPGALAAQWQAAGMLSAGDPSSRLRGCRELIQASLGAAYAKAKNELAGHTYPSQQQQEAGQAHLDGVLVVTGSLHTVAATQGIEEVAMLLARAQHHEQ
ncbi:Mur ligase [Dunaliella salina]|uniref:Mur ligase n=1 Tax=Dunaliella salina TaxID=3046 RepID=A0ABQ7GRL3_DUNSA|nr:Mur ligase [Dunaliella salina]|eukprot:KAF5837251.1 Mur ligase [Dunaliella salina]